MSKEKAVLALNSPAPSLIKPCRKGLTFEYPKLYIPHSAPQSGTYAQPHTAESRQDGFAIFNFFQKSISMRLFCFSKIITVLTGILMVNLFLSTAAPLFAQPVDTQDINPKTSMFGRQFKRAIEQFAADIEEIHTALSFGEKLKEGIVPIASNTEWSISGDNGFSQSGIGFDLFDVVFATPGNYRISALTKHDPLSGDCDHGDQSFEANVVVSPVKITYTLNPNFWIDLISSNPIFTGQVVQVPVDVAIYEDSDLSSYSNIPLAIQVAGVKCNAKGLGVLSVSDLNAGSTTVDFTFNGTAKSPNGYVTIDFKDHLENIQSLPISKKMN